MWEVSELQFRKQSDAFANDLKRSNFVVSNQIDFDCDIAQMVKNGSLEFFSKSQVSCLVMSSTPSMLFTVWANLNNNLVTHCSCRNDKSYNLIDEIKIIYQCFNWSKLAFWLFPSFVNLLFIFSCKFLQVLCSLYILLF